METDKTDVYLVFEVGTRYDTVILATTSKEKASALRDKDPSWYYIENYTLEKEYT
jgi:hypothetical protein